MAALSSGQRTRVLAVLAVLAGCGRFGYDAHGLDGLDAATADADPADAPADATPPPPAPVYCDELPRLADVPTIDGNLEAGLGLRALPPDLWLPTATSPPAGQSASYALAWLPDGLYVYVHVVDSSRVPADAGQFRWCGDGVEVYVDDDGSYDASPLYDDPGTRQLIFAAPANASTGTSGGEVWCATCGDTVPDELPTSRFVTVPVTDGYAFEGRVVAADLGLATWTLAAADHIGLDLAVNVSGDAPTGDGCVYDGSAQGSRVGEYFLRIGPGTDDYPFNGVTAFCRPVLTP